MNKITIEKAANGYIACECHTDYATSYMPYVFESFDSLAEWLKGQLVQRKPE